MKIYEKYASISSFSKQNEFSLEEPGGFYVVHTVELSPKEIEDASKIYKDDIQALLKLLVYVGKVNKKEVAYAHTVGVLMDIAKQEQHNAANLLEK